MGLSGKGGKNYRAWFKLNKDFIPPEDRDIFEKGIEQMHFYRNIYFKILDNLAPALYELMLEQYPVFKTEKRPMVLEAIHDISITIGSTLILKLDTLLQGQYNGVKIREKYPKFDEWVEFYARPGKPYTVDETNRCWYEYLNDKEWEEYRDNENRILLEYFNWQEKRKFEFIDLLQTILFKYYEELKELNADEWIIYAVHIRDEYEDYLTSCEDLELFIDCGFPEENVNFTNEEFQTNYSKLSDEIRDYASKLRNRRIAGETI